MKDIFNPDAKCSKCGFDDITVAHCDGYTHNCFRRGTTEHLHRTCARCGYRWIEMCLDSEKKE